MLAAGEGDRGSPNSAVCLLQEKVIGGSPNSAVGLLQVNGTGGLLTEQRVNLKNLPLEEVLGKARVIVAELERLEEYHRGEGMRYQKMLGDFYWDYSSHRKDIGDTLSECGYAGNP